MSYRHRQMWVNRVEFGKTHPDFIVAIALLCPQMWVCINEPGVLFWLKLPLFNPVHPQISRHANSYRQKVVPNGGTNRRQYFLWQPMGAHEQCTYFIPRLRAIQTRGNCDHCSKWALLGTMQLGQRTERRYIFAPGAPDGRPVHPSAWGDCRHPIACREAPIAPTTICWRKTSWPKRNSHLIKLEPM